MSHKKVAKTLNKIFKDSKTLMLNNCAPSSHCELAYVTHVLIFRNFQKNVNVNILERDKIFQSLL